MGWSDPGCGWQPGRVRGSSLEALGVSPARAVEGFSALREEGVGAARRHALWGQQPEARVAVEGVVPGEEARAVGAGVFEAAEPRGAVGTVVARVDLRFGRRIVLGGRRSAVWRGARQIDRQGGPRRAAHAGAAVGVAGVRVPGAMGGGAPVSALRGSARWAGSRRAIIPPTPERLTISRSTDRGEPGQVTGSLRFVRSPRQPSVGCHARRVGFASAGGRH